MNLKQIAASLDHTLLSPTATWNEIRTACDEGAAFGVASVCIPPCFVQEAFIYLGGQVPVCTVIGFPHGNTTTSTKLHEATTAIEDGASEVDMVINVGYLKEGRTDHIFSEISGIKSMIGEEHILKVIVETCLLTNEEKKRMCILCEQAGADYIKTSTGFSTGGATPADIELFARHAGKKLKVKASGGIGSLEDAESFLNLGASRLGSSRVVALLREQGYRK